MVVEDFMMLDMALALAAGLAQVILVACRRQAAEIEKAACWRLIAVKQIWLDLRTGNGTESFFERQSQAQQL